MDHASPQVCACADIPEGSVRFATAEERDSASLRLHRAGMLVAELEGIGPSARGRLGEVVAEIIERELAVRGAAGPGLASDADRDARLSDQLYRARRAGATGIALVLGPLRGAAGELGALDPSDCATLRFLAEATKERPIALLLDARDTRTGGYGEPVALVDLLAPFAFSAPLGGPDGDRKLANDSPAPAPPAVAVAPEPPDPISFPLPAPVRVASATVTPAAPAALADPPRDNPPAEETWKPWVQELAAARGPQPLATLERLFVDAYVPLAYAVDAGLDDPRAQSARNEFRETFAAGYVEAFPTLAATVKRPRMVLDAHDLAARIGRLHGARTTRVLLVDSMRWDLSRRIQVLLAAKVGGLASLTDETVLWSALPATTMRQLETIARGVDALRAPAPAEGDPIAPRTRNAEHVRRMRVGPRELYKLDVVDAMLSAARREVVGALPEIAEATATAIARHVETLPPRTLVLVLGDHGFRIDKTGAAREGGASPEEVLVGAWALLAGEVH